MNKIAIMSVLVVFLSSCSGQVKEVSCAVNDWNLLGQKIAKAGDSVRTFELYKDQCSSIVGEAERQAFLDGFTQGIIEYCTFDNGLKLGNSSRPMTNTCPPELAGIFAKGYQIGKLEHDDKMHKLKRYSDLNELQGDLTESEQVANRAPPSN